MDSITEAKAALRRQLRASRAALPEAARDQASRLIRSRLLRLPVVQTAESVFLFVSYDAEVDTHPLVDILLEGGRRLAVPKIIDATTMRSVPLRDWQELQPEKLGILAPVTSDPDPGPFDVIITPGVAFTESGHRLGYGRGYYDRWFERHPGGCKIALAFEAQIVAELPLEATDVPVDLIVTERRLIRPGGDMARCRAATRS